MKKYAWVGLVLFACGQSASLAPDDAGAPPCEPPLDATVVDAAPPPPPTPPAPSPAPDATPAPCPALVDAGAVLTPLLPARDGGVQATYIAIGDSITVFGSYPNQTANVVGGTIHTFRNLAVIGTDTTTQLADLDASLGPPLDAAAGPHVLTLMLGVNDAWHEGRTNEQIVANLRAYVDEAHRRGWRVIQLTPPPDQVPSFGARYAGFVQLMLADCRDAGSEGCLDLSTDRQLAAWTSDGVHPTIDGAQRIAVHLAPVLVAVLLDAGATP